MMELSMSESQFPTRSASMIESWKLAANRAVQTLRLFLSSEVRWTAIGWLTLLLALLFSQNGLNVVNSFVGRDFVTAISQRRPRQFVALAVTYGSVFAVQAVAAAFYRFSEERLRLLWRGWLTDLLIGRYMSGDTYYRMKRVPRQPLTVHCTIRSVLLVTTPERTYSDAEISAALAKVGLESLETAIRWHSTTTWSLSSKATVPGS